MATMSATRIRSLYCRHTQASEAALREPGRSFHRRVLGNPNHRNLANTIRRRALLRRRPTRDGKGRGAKMTGARETVSRCAGGFLACYLLADKLSILNCHFCQ
jgi:hypothetical protein